MSLRTSALVLLALAACSPRPSDFTGSATTGPADLSSTGAAAGSDAADPLTGAGPSSTTGTTGTVATTGAEATSTGSSTTASDFVAQPDYGPTKGCEPFLDDCPEGQKCAAVGEGYQSLACVPLVRDPAGLYEPCTLVGADLDGGDTCGPNLMCWNPDPDTGVGTCWGLCLGSFEAPTCADPEATCHIGRSALFLCIPACDPLLQDCSEDETCIPNPQDPDKFVCVLDAGGEEGQTFDPCEYANACDPGTYCVDPALADPCDPQALGCCLPWCDVAGPPCPDPGLECIPWFEEGAEPPGHEDLGVCGTPP